MKLIKGDMPVEIKVLKKIKIRVAYSYVIVSIEIPTGVKE
jgi:hypothetical protein